MQVPHFGSPEALALRGALQQSIEGPLEAALSAVESQLESLAEALQARESRGIDLHARELHLALAHAMDVFTSAARHGGVPRDLRRRLMLASGEVAAQREAFSRATAALDRALDVLLPSDPSPVYSSPLS